jgi:hypothetical protein
MQKAIYNIFRQIYAKHSYYVDYMTYKNNHYLYCSHKMTI